MLDYFALALRLNGIVAHSIVHAQNQKSILIEFSFALLDFHPFFMPPPLAAMHVNILIRAIEKLYE